MGQVVVIPVLPDESFTCPWSPFRTLKYLTASHLSVDFQPHIDNRSHSAYNFLNFLNSICGTAFLSFTVWLLF